MYGSPPLVIRIHHDIAAGTRLMLDTEIASFTAEMRKASILQPDYGKSGAKVYHFRASPHARPTSLHWVDPHTLRPRRPRRVRIDLLSCSKERLVLLQITVP